MQEIPRIFEALCQEPGTETRHHLYYTLGCTSKFIKLQTFSMYSILYAKHTSINWDKILLPSRKTFTEF